MAKARTPTRAEIERQESAHFTPSVLLGSIRRLDLDLPERSAITYRVERDDVLLRRWRDRCWNHAVQARARDGTLPPLPSPSGNNRRDIEALTAWASSVEVSTQRGGGSRDRGRWPTDVEKARQQVDAEPKPEDAERESDDAIDDLVTLDQAAAVVSQSKRTLERYLHRGDLPRPDVLGGGGRASRWYWSALRPALEEHFRPNLPTRFPASRVV